MTTTRTDLPAIHDEKTTLTTMLDYARATAHVKCEDLTDADARKAPLPNSPLMTISGLVNHQRWVEYSWFRTWFLGEEDEGPWTNEDPDREMRMAVEIPLAQLLAEYEAECQVDRELVAANELDAPSKRLRRDGESFPLRWILFHLLEQTSRHNGHIDILRELADGSTGD